MPASFAVLMVLVALGVGRLVNPLLLAYFFALGYVVLGVYEGRESLPAEAEEPEASEDAEPRGERRSSEGSGRANG